MNKLDRISVRINQCNVDLSEPGMTNTKGMAIMAFALNDIQVILKEDDLDIVKPTASEVKQMLDELKKELQAEFRDGIRTHIDHYHRHSSGGSF